MKCGVEEFLRLGIWSHDMMVMGMC